VQLDRLAPAAAKVSSGVSSPSGVQSSIETVSAVAGAVSARGITRGWVRHLVLVALACGTLLGQGERSRVDPRFVSPSATLTTYWEALRAGDAGRAWECFVEGRHNLPLPGMLWFLPPTTRVTLGEFRSLPVTGGRVMVRYEVRYIPVGTLEEHRFRTGDELVRLRGEWRIARPLGQASMPEWREVPRPVDI
jgi:hypothetical protein